MIVTKTNSCLTSPKFFISYITYISIFQLGPNQRKIEKSEFVKYLGLLIDENEVACLCSTALFAIDQMIKILSHIKYCYCCIIVLHTFALVIE